MSLFNEMTNGLDDAFVETLAWITIIIISPILLIVELIKKLKKNNKIENGKNSNF